MKRLHIIRRIKHRIGYYQNSKKVFNLTTVYFILLVIFSAVIIYNCSSRLCDFAMLVGKDKLRNEITKDCSAIISALIYEHNLEYNSIVTTKIGENGKINSISTDFHKINMLKNSLEQQLTDMLNLHNCINCKIPIGAVVFDNVFTAWGIEIPIPLLTSSSVSVEFYDEFTGAGINQTKHSILLKVNIYSKIHTFLKSTNEEIRLDIPVAETIIVDNVPNYMFPSPPTK